MEKFHDNCSHTDLLLQKWPQSNANKIVQRIQEYNSDQIDIKHIETFVSKIIKDEGGCDIPDLSSADGQCKVIKYFNRCLTKTYSCQLVEMINEYSFKDFLVDIIVTRMVYGIDNTQLKRVYIGEYYKCYGRVAFEDSPFSIMPTIVDVHRQLKSHILSSSLSEIETGLGQEFDEKLKDELMTFRLIPEDHQPSGGHIYPWRRCFKAQIEIINPRKYISQLVQQGKLLESEVVRTYLTEPDRN